MPTYEYVCESCEHEFEEFQAMSAKPLKKCPSCEKPKLRRKIGTGAGIIFKGSGFYETDYRSDTYRKAEKAEKETSSGSSEGSGAAAKTESSGSGSESPAKQAPAKTEAKPSTKSASKPAKTAKAGA